MFSKHGRKFNCPKWAKRFFKTYNELLNFFTNRLLRVETIAIVDYDRVEQIFLRNDFLLKSSGDGSVFAPVQQIVPAYDQVFKGESNEELL